MLDTCMPESHPLGHSATRDVPHVKVSSHFGSLGTAQSQRFLCDNVDDLGKRDWGLYDRSKQAVGGGWDVVNIHSLAWHKVLSPTGWCNKLTPEA